MASARANRPELRRDPKPRSTGASPVFQIANADPNRRYVWVFLATPADGPSPEYYGLIGYEREVFGPDSPCPRGMKFKDGEEIVVRGNLLMSIDKDRYAEIVKYGVDGDHGQVMADEQEKLLIKRRGGFDPLRGQTGLHGRGGAPVAYAVNEIAPLTGELGVG